MLLLVGSLFLACGGGGGAAPSAPDRGAPAVGGDRLRDTLDPYARPAAPRPIRHHTALGTWPIAKDMVARSS